MHRTRSVAGPVAAPAHPPSALHTGSTASNNTSAVTPASVSASASISSSAAAIYSAFTSMISSTLGNSGAPQIPSTSPKGSVTTPLLQNGLRSDSPSGIAQALREHRDEVTDDKKHTPPAPANEKKQEATKNTSGADFVVDFSETGTNEEYDALFALMEQNLPEIIPAVEAEFETMLVAMDEKDRELFDDANQQREHGNEAYFKGLKGCGSEIDHGYFRQPARKVDHWYLPSQNPTTVVKAPTGDYVVPNPEDYSLSLAANLKKIEEARHHSRTAELAKTIGSVIVTAPMGLYMLKTDETRFKIASFTAYMLLNTIINRRTLGVAPPIVYRYLTNIKNNFKRGKYLAALKDVTILLMSLGTSVAMGSISFETTSTKLPQVLALIYSVLVGLTFGSTRTFGLDRLRQRLEKYFHPGLGLHKQDEDHLNAEHKDFKARRVHQLHKAEEQLKLLDKNYRECATLKLQLEKNYLSRKINQQQQAQTNASAKKHENKKGWATLRRKLETQLTQLKQDAKKLDEEQQRDRSKLETLAKTLKQPEFCGIRAEDKRFTKLSEHYQETVREFAHKLYAKDSKEIKHIDAIFDSKEDIRLQKVLDDTKNECIVTLARKIIVEEDVKQLELHKKELNQVLAAPSKDSSAIMQTCLDLRARHLDREQLAQKLHNHCTSQLLKVDLETTYESERLLECKKALVSYDRLTRGLPELKEDKPSSWSSLAATVADCIFAGIVGCSATFPFAQRFFQGAESIPGLNYAVTGPVASKDAVSILFNLSTAVFYFVQNSALRGKVLDAFKTLRGTNGELRKAKAAELIVALGFSGLSSLGVYNLFLGIASAKGDQRIFNWLTENSDVFNMGAYCAAAGASGLNLMFWLDARFQPRVDASIVDEPDPEWEMVGGPVLVRAEKEEQPLKVAMAVNAGTQPAAGPGITTVTNTAPAINSILSVATASSSAVPPTPSQGMDTPAPSATPNHQVLVATVTPVVPSGSKVATPVAVTTDTHSAQHQPLQRPPSFNREFSKGATQRFIYGSGASSPTDLKSNTSPPERAPLVANNSNNSLASNQSGTNSNTSSPGADESPTNLTSSRLRTQRLVVPFSMPKTFMGNGNGLRVEIPVREEEPRGSVRLGRSPRSQ